MLAASPCMITLTLRVRPLFSSRKVTVAVPVAPLPLSRTLTSPSTGTSSALSAVSSGPSASAACVVSVQALTFEQVAGDVTWLEFSTPRVVVTRRDTPFRPLPRASTSCDPITVPAVPVSVPAVRSAAAACFALTAAAGGAPEALIATGGFAATTVMTCSSSAATAKSPPLRVTSWTKICPRGESSSMVTCS